MINSCSSGEKELCTIKVDFFKAFDCVNWSFLLSLLKARGFSPRWYHWISHILSSSKSIVLVNGSPSSFFQCHRGLKQGDPLSPMLFLLVVDVLNKMISASFSAGDLPNLNLKGEFNSIRSLQFADDTLIFCKADNKDIFTLKSILFMFGSISGLHINPSKSTLFYLGKVPSRGVHLANKLNCSNGSLPFFYLGFPLKKDSLSRRE
ncbi:uncharacterized protein LOC109841822 [Asparagus officinalis]|uniref:uncharacterized protein LOC109841822 n=1 Tax=Asparagus officinalis TaxID=4686 RepID=UPI00098E6EE1|nr:uncharacterized protein LOC109841822 [Asparagus officinalis]